MHVVYFSPVVWNSIEQRPQEFVRWLNRRYGAKIDWIDPYPTRLPQFGDFRVLGAESSIPVQEPPVWLRVWTPGWLPIEPIPGSLAILSGIWSTFLKALSGRMTKKSLVVIGKPSKLATVFSSMFPESLNIFDMMDNFEAFYAGLSSKAMAQNTRMALASADLVLFSSDALSAKYSNSSKRSAVVLNAYNKEKFPPASKRTTSPLPENPTYGYVGTIGSWFDWDLVVELAVTAPLSTIDLVGPVYKKPQGSLPRNIRVIGPLPNSHAISHMYQFSAGIIPFKLNMLTDFVDPIKYYEYRAAGIPVLTSSFGQMRGRGPGQGVWKIAPNELKNQLDAFLSQISSSDHSGAPDIVDWDSRFSGSELDSFITSHQAAD